MPNNSNPELFTIPPHFAFSPSGSIDIPTQGELLTIDSSEDKISFLSDFDINRDQQGLQVAQALLRILQSSIAVMQADMAVGNLPPVLSLNNPSIKKNPFD